MFQRQPWTWDRQSFGKNHYVISLRVLCTDGWVLNPELLSASDRQCVGLVVQCMFQCRVHNLNRISTLDNCPAAMDRMCFDSLLFREGLVAQVAQMGT